jgi:type II secretory pathway pseudopilin PulG
MKKKIKKWKGFSLVESVLAIFLVSFGIMAIIPLLSTSIRETFDSRDQMIATLLVQEGIEIMRNIRDNHWAKEEEGFPASFNNGSEGCVSYNSTDLSTAGCSGGNYSLSKNGDLFVHDPNGTLTKFQRRIEVTGTDTKKVTTMVIWRGSFPDTVSECKIDPLNQKGCVYLETELTNWGG